MGQLLVKISLLMCFVGIALTVYSCAIAENTSSANITFVCGWWIVAVIIGLLGGKAQ